MANIRVDALTEVATIADDDVVMVDGKQGVRATTWGTLKNLIKQQCGINELNTNIRRNVVVNTNLVPLSDIACYKRGNIVFLCGNLNIKNAGQNQNIATLQDNIASGVSYFPMAGYSGKCGEGQIEKNNIKISVPAAGYYRFSCWYVSS